MRLSALPSWRVRDCKHRLKARLLRTLAECHRAPTSPRRVESRAFGCLGQTPMLTLLRHRISLSFLNRPTDRLRPCAAILSGPPCRKMNPPQGPFTKDVFKMDPPPTSTFHVTSISTACSLDKKIPPLDSLSADVICECPLPPSSRSPS